MFALSLHAANVSWNVPAGQSGNWSTGTNWTGGAPTSSSTAYIVNGGTATVTALNATCGTLSLGSSAGSGAVQMTTGSLSAVNNEYIGDSGTGNFTQSGGSNSVPSSVGGLYLGNSPGGGGTYNLSGNGWLSVTYSEYVGLSGTGAFTQTGGTNGNGSLNLGYNGNSSGTYSLSGRGQLSASYEYVGDQGAGTFTQTGGTNSISYGSLILGQNAGGSGTYSLGGSGLLSVSSLYGEYVGLSATGTFTQSGGTNNNSNGPLYLGYLGSSSGTYSLSGSGLLLALSEYVGSSGTGTFTQSGGTNTVSLLSVGSGSTYLLAGGALQVTGNLVNQGIIAGNGTPALLSANGILDLTSGTWRSLGTLSLSMSANSLLIVPAGFNTSTGFAHYSTLGLTHTVGTTLTVPAGKSIVGSGTINDSVNCLGTITASASGAINLSGGLTLSGTGTINLGSGNLTTNDLQSQISGGSLSVYNHYVGSEGTGTFAQSGGTNSIGTMLYLGTNAGDSGTYNLSSSGLLSAGYAQYVGYSGTGTFTQSGGTNNISSTYTANLVLGYNSGSSGTYSLSGRGQLLTDVENVAYYGTGTFTQSGGTNTINDALVLGVYGNGTYNLSSNGQLLLAGNAYLGEYGAATFTQSGGTNAIAGFLLLASNSGGSCTYSLSGRGQLSASYEYVGDQGAGTFTQTGGTNNISQVFALGGFGGSSGTYNLNGGLLIIPYVGSSSGTAAFNFGGGTLQASSAMSISLPMTLTGSGGNANLNTAGYAVLLSDPLSGPGGLTKLGSGMLTLAATNTYSGNTLIGGGTLALGSSLALQNSTLDTSGSGVLSFGSLTAGTLGGLTGPGTLSMANSSSSPVALAVGNNNASTTFSGALKGTGSVIKIGSGVLALSGTNTFTGPTTVGEGKLVVDGRLINSAVSVNGGTLGGTGYLGSVTVNAGGTLAPGDPLGTLSISGNLILESGAWMDYELDMPSTSDMISCGTLTLSGQQFSDFTFTWSANFGPGNYNLIDAGLVSGVLGTSTSGTINGDPATLSVHNNDLVLNVAPEPSAFALLAAGAIGLVGYGSWRRWTTGKTAKPTVFGQHDDVPAILSLPSRSSQTNAARRAA
jgi:autotransporter-associated beta strand protein